MSENTFTPPASVAAQAKQGLEMRNKFKRGGTSVGATRAGQLSNRNPISLSVVRRMHSFFSRHEVDKKGKDWGNESNPSAGYVAWKLWGGDSGWAWAKGILNKHDKVSESTEMEETDEDFEISESTETTSGDVPVRNKPAGKEDPCWDGYEMVGTKKKKGKTVPNCVPKQKIQEDLELLKENWKRVAINEVLTKLEEDGRIDEWVRKEHWIDKEENV